MKNSQKSCEIAPIFLENSPKKHGEIAKNSRPKLRKQPEKSMAKSQKTAAQKHGKIFNNASIIVMAPLLQSFRRLPW